MGSLSGILQRPVLAASTVALASVYSDLPDKFRPSNPLEHCSSLEQSSSSISTPIKEANSSWVSKVSVSKLANLSFMTRIRIPLPNINYPVPNSGHGFVSSGSCSSVASSPFLLNLYQSADLTKTPKPTAYTLTVPPSSSSSEVLYTWHLPEPNAVDVSGNSECSSAKSRTVVVLLGWLGAKQKHLKKYADWYTSKGFHAITFTFPMSEVLSYKVGGKAEEHVELLVNHLADWLEEEHGKNLVFHTFSNTGWLTYGAILEKFQKQDLTLMGRIRGCVVDSAPVAAPDPQNDNATPFSYSDIFEQRKEEGRGVVLVWASGFSAAFLKKHSVATKGYTRDNEQGLEVSGGTKSLVEAKPAITETALLLVLEKFFEVVLNLPAVNRRLSDVVGQLTSGQPSCPQLYIYSSADKVIPARSVESFIEEQQKTGRENIAALTRSSSSKRQQQNRVGLWIKTSEDFWAARVKRRQALTWRLGGVGSGIDSRQKQGDSYNEWRERERRKGECEGEGSSEREKHG
ncbi:hypothetical protein RJ639_003743 [Escallonia herrerae]|uniref:Transmembrane protein 53 n=1 Tax=Escallonia herrerae TaxID=1293975 RepID=A0AA89AY71_9ASTE|nr:hypothetical protein RJ639_003743 [Escallonia herrerae]